MGKARANVTFGLIIIALVALCYTCFQPVTAQNQNIVTINEDGSIKPSTAPILQEGTTYTLTNDINGMIVITKSNITFNGNGHTINQYASFQDSSNAHGIFLSQVFNVTVANTTIINSGNGIYAIQEPTAGIQINYGGSNTLTMNNIMNNFNGILLFETNHNIINQNNLTNSNNPYGIGYEIELWGASDNKIYQNNFIDNKSPAIVADFNSQSLRNSWDNGKEGNFWGDYTGTDVNGDGIGDTSYEIFTKNKSGALFPKNTDHYPLMQPFNSTLYSLKITPPSISILSPTERTYNKSDVHLTFSIDKPVNYTGYVLDEISNVTLSGNTTLAGLAVGTHNITIYAQDTFVNIGSSETIFFTIAKPEKSESFPVLRAAAISIAVSVLVGAGLVVYLKKRKR